MAPSRCTLASRARIPKTGDMSPDGSDNFCSAPTPQVCAANGFGVEDMTGEEWHGIEELAPPEEQARLAEWLRTGEGAPWRE